MVGTTVEHYRIEAVLGRGGMGEVYRATDTRLNRAVAIKFLPEASAAAHAVDRFFREARAASALNHPNIVTIHEVGRTADGGHFIVQELIEGRTLTTFVADPPSIETVASIGAQVARALGVAHAAGIAHRDIKPDNVMLRPDGYVKVLDFGLARQTGEQAETATTTGEHTTPGVLMGTVPYMSPEQALGDPVGAASDVFSLGIVLYELTTGRRPFVAESGFGVLNAIVKEHPVAPSRLRGEVPPELDALVLSMLAKSAALRPSAAEVAAALTSLQRPGVTQVVVAPPSRPRTVGRDRELESLRAAFGDIVGGHGLLLGIAGEPGIGKTSLVEDFLSTLMEAGEPATVLRGKCSERLAGTEAFLPIFEALDDLQQRRTIGSFSEMLKTIAPSWFVQVGPALTESAASMQVREDVKTTSPERMKRELAALFQEVSRVSPVVLFFEDLHWADVSTIDLINYLSSRFDSIRVLIVVTYRPADMMLARHPFLQIRPDLQARGLFREIPLTFLTLAELQRYLALEFPGHEFPEEFGAILHARTEGSPLFMVDVVRYLRDRRVIEERNGRWVLAQSVPDIQRELPESVRGTITRNIERLDDTDRKLLLAASVQGHEFDSAIVAESAGFDPADVEERLESLDRIHGLVRMVVSAELPDFTLSVRYRFVHVLYQNVLYASLQPSRKAALSAKTAAALCAHHGAQAAELASELALLFEAARDFRRAAESFLTAAQRVAGLFAFREAVVLSQRGLAALKVLPDTPERQQLELGLQLTFGLSLRSLQGWAAPDVEPIYVRARQLCQKLGDAPELFPALWGLALFHAIRGDLAVFLDLAQQLLAIADAEQNRMFQVGANQMAGSVREFRGETIDSGRHFERAIELYDPADHAAYTAAFGLDPGMITRSLSVRPLWFLGQPDRALQRSLDTVALARQLRQPISLVFAICLQVDLHLLRREPAAVIATADEEIALCREYGLAQEMEWGRSFQAWGFAEAGRVDDALVQLQDSLAVQDRMRAGLLRPTFLTHLAHVFLLAGRPADGLEALDQAFAWAERTGERYYLAETWRLRGELLRAEGRIADSEAAGREGIRVAHSQGALSLELRGATSLARLLRAEGRRAEAHDILTTPYARFGEGFDTADLVDARALLAEGPA